MTIERIVNDIIKEGVANSYDKRSDEEKIREVRQEVNRRISELLNEAEYKEHKSNYPWRPNTVL